MGYNYTNYMASNQSKNLTFGSHGPEVSDLQETLKQHGLYTGPIDGIYSQSMNQSVKQFQQMAGITADGIYGPQTTSVLNDWTQHPIKFAMAEPAIQQLMQQNPQFANTMQVAAKNGGNQADMLAVANFMSKASAASGAPNPGYLDQNGNVSGDVFQQMALQRASPQIAQSLNYYGNDFAQGVQNEKNQYASNLAGAQQNITNQNATLQTQQGQNNNVNSGWGNVQRNQFRNAANTSLNALQSGAQTTLSSLARNYENQLGTGALASTGQNFGMAGAGGVGKAGTYNQGQAFNAYSPLGGQQGSLTAQWLSQTQNTANQLRNGAQYQVPAFNQYTAASSLGGNAQNYPYYPTQ